MRRHLPVLASLLMVLALSARADAQIAITRPAATPSTAARGHIDGIVRDQSGTALGNASVLAFGAALAVVRTDRDGRFSLSLPPGHYIVQAVLRGYLSAALPPVRVRSDEAESRSITLMRTDASLVQPDTQAVQPITDAPAAGEAPSELAWRLRHLPRTALRDEGGAAAPWAGASDAAADKPAWVSEVRTLARFGDDGLRGQVNFLATSSVPDGGQGPLGDDWSRGVAYVVVGAPVGAHGQWSIRAAMAPGERAAWAFQGEYAADADRRHAFRAGASYTAHDDAVAGSAEHALAQTAVVRRVSGVYAYDRWTVQPELRLDYGAKVARYDYLADPSVFGARLVLEADVLPGLIVRMAARPRMVAPGGEQFLPPATAGVWLPPERTFDAIDGALRAERVLAYEVGAAAGVTDTVVAGIKAFYESTDDQIATVFGLDDWSEPGRYHVGALGAVVVRGVSVELSGRVLESTTAEVAYTRTLSEWIASAGPLLRARIPSLSRTGLETGHDLTTQVEALLPTGSTRVRMAYRASSLFAEAGPGHEGPGLSGRFRLEVRQQLPYRPLSGADVNLLVAVGTLLRDRETEASFYDELLTVAPPLQVVCGIQMRF